MLRVELQDDELQLVEIIELLRQVTKKHGQLPTRCLQRPTKNVSAF